PETHLIPLTIFAVRGGRPLTVFGTDYPTQDGTCVRDYVHVTDLAQAHLQALEYLKTGGPTTVVNLGAGRGYSVKEVIASVEAVSGRGVPVILAPRRAGDAPALIADCTKARAVLGWTPKFSDLDTIIRHAWGWFARPHTFEAGYSS